MANRSPAKTYTVDDFIDMKYIDETTFRRFSILEKLKEFGDVEHLDHNLIEDYIELLDVVEVPLDDEQFKKYKYRPDLLAYDVYGSTQVDYVILMINDMYDPKEFCKKKIYLPYASVLDKFMDTIFSCNEDYIEQNREINDIIE